MPYPIPTVRVKTDAQDNPMGFYLINEKDFDAAVHERFDDVKVRAKPGPKPRVRELSRDMT